MARVPYWPMADSLDSLRSALAARYAVEGELGRGGMAAVYLATDLKHGRRVALKVLDPGLARAIGPQRFLQEIQLAAGLTHPNILPVHDSGEAEGLLYYIMPYIEGESLRDRLTRERHLELDDTVRIVRDIAAALSHAHGHGVIHRDIKPENILFAGGQAVVADFGIARAVDAAGGERLTETGLAVGTPAYMSPEQANADRSLDARSDIYSLGCLAYEMLGGEPPFSGPSPQAVMARHSVDPVPRLRTLRPTIPEAVERALERALAKVPADRFATADQFATALARAGAAPATMEQGRRAPNAVRRRWLAVAAGGLLVAAAGWWWWTMASDPAVERLAVLPPTNLTHPSDQEHIVQGMLNGLITELGHAGVPVVGGLQSMMRYRNTDKTVREIAADLGVDAVIESSVLWLGDSVGIDARLIDGRTERTLWSQSYSEDSRNVLALYKEVTRAIAGEIRLALTPQAEARLASASPVQPPVYEAYLMGQFHWYKLSAPDLEAALRYFESAVERDPRYAPAHAGISRVWIGRQQMGLAAPRDATPPAKAAARRALELDSTLAEAHYTMALVRTWLEWDWDGGGREFERAIALDPTYADVRAHYSHFLMIMGRPDEAMAQMERALALDPLNVLFQDLKGMNLFFLRRYDDAIAQFRQTLQTAPSHPLARMGLWGALHEKRAYDEALAELKALLAAEGDQEAEAALGDGYAESGYAGAMTRLAGMLALRSRTRYVPPERVARLYMYAGHGGRALDWLERSLEAREPNMRYVGVVPVYAGLHDDPRFRDLLRRMALPR